MDYYGGKRAAAFKTATRIQYRDMKTVNLVPRDEGVWHRSRHNDLERSTTSIHYCFLSHDCSPTASVGQGEYLFGTYTIHGKFHHSDR